MGHLGSRTGRAARCRTVGRRSQVRHLSFEVADAARLSRLYGAPSTRRGVATSFPITATQWANYRKKVVGLREVDHD